MMYRDNTRLAGMDVLMDVLVDLTQLTLSIDYSHKSTIPAPGETLSVGWFARWYGFRLARVASKVSVLRLCSHSPFK